MALSRLMRASLGGVAGQGSRGRDSESRPGPRRRAPFWRGACVLCLPAGWLPIQAGSRSSLWRSSGRGCGGRGWDGSQGRWIWQDDAKRYLFHQEILTSPSAAKPKENNHSLCS
ncbi:hypothetical protein H8959_018373 [Pygathrix nigripes]